jgi:hypothetical protein
MDIGPAECPRCPGMHHWPQHCPNTPERVAAVKEAVETMNRLQDAGKITILPTVRIVDHDRNDWLNDPALHRQVIHHLRTLLRKIEFRSLSLEPAEVRLLEVLRDAIESR